MQLVPFIISVGHLILLQASQEREDVLPTVAHGA